MTTEVFANTPTPGTVVPVVVLQGNGGSISPTATSFNVSAPLPTYLQSTGQFRALIDSEWMIIPCQTGTALTGVTRGSSLASPDTCPSSAHSDGAGIYPVLTAGALNNALAAAGGGSVTSPNGTISVTDGTEIDVEYGTTAETAAEGNDSRITGALQKTGGTMSGAVAMGSNKVTGLTNGSASSDAAAFGQIPTALPPNGSAGGSLTGSYPNPTIATIPSTATGTTQAALTDNTTMATTAYADGAVAAERTATETYTNKRITRRVVTVTQSATPAIDTDNTDVASITGLAQAITSMTSSLTGTPVDGDALVVRITDNGTARAVTWGASFEASTVALPTTTVISTLLTVGFFWNTATSKWRCVAVA